MADPWVKNTQVWLNSEYSSHSQWVWVDEDGQTGWPTIEGLIRALQIELGITNLSPNFGPTTFAQLTSQFGDIGVGQHPGANIIKIIQGGSYCKGFNVSDGALDGNFDSQMQTTVSSMRTSVGLTATPATVTPKLFRGLLSMDAWVLVSGGTAAARQAQQALNRRYISRAEYYLCPTDGLYGRQMQEKLMIALQYEGGISAPNGNFGPATQAAVNANGLFNVGFSDSSGYWVHLFQAALRFNGYPNTPFNGTFDAATQVQMQAFQDYIALANSTGATFSTWASLLVSAGDPNRPATGADCIMEITPARLATLQSQGYTHFGRYLVNTPGPLDLNKALRRNEISTILGGGGKIWPIFQTGGDNPAHFTAKRGREVAEEASNAAWAYRIPAGSVIYFAVDFDVLDEEIIDRILPYFAALNAAMPNSLLSTYRVGVYAPRLVCQRVTEAGLAVYSWASDMSEAFSGNKGFLLPPNWTFDQIHELDIGTGNGAIRIDRNVVSGRDNGFSAQAPQIGVGNDPIIPATKFDGFETDWFSWCVNNPQDSLVPVIQANRATVRALVQQHDGYITTRSAQLGVYKALGMTTLIWEAMVINPTDPGVDQLVIAYYAALEAGLTPPPGTRPDASTGPCQIFAETAIPARNWAKSKGLIADGPYDVTNWQDMKNVWFGLYGNEEFNIETSILVSMYNAETKCGVGPSSIRTLTPSDVSWVYQAYNGWDSPRGLIYGREKAQLHYLIRKWHESFR